jgi:hypothetical protein
MESLVLRGSLDMIHNQDLHRAFLGFQLQPELLLHSGEDIRTRSQFRG